MRKTYIGLLLSSVLLLSVGCSKKQTKRQPEPQSGDHVALDDAAAATQLVHSVFPVENYRQFTFVIPPHQMRPKLHGDFQSFTNKNDPNSSSDAANVDVLLLDDQQLDDFVHGRAGETTYQLESSHSQTIDYAVPGTRDDPRQYHLVFQASSGGSKIFVKADFRVTFE